MMVILYLFNTPALLQPLNHFVQDRLLELRSDNTTPEKIIIIDIDDQSLENIGPWPWSREMMAHLIAQIFEQHDPKVLAIDMVMPESRDEIGDQQLAQLFRQHPICLSIAFDIEPDNNARQVGYLSKGELVTQKALPATGYIASHQTLAQSAQCVGHISPKVDADGLIRRLPAQIAWQQKQWPMLAQSMMNFTQSTYQKASSDAQYLNIPYRVQANAWQSVPAQSLILQQLPEGYLDGAYLLLGSSALGLSDRVATPIHPWLPGVAIHAEMLYKLQNPPDYLSWMGKELSLLFALIIIVVLAVLFIFTRTYWVLIASILFIVLWLWVTALNIYTDKEAMIALPMVALFSLLLLQLPYEWLIVNRYNRWITEVFHGYLSKSVVDQLIESRQDVLEPVVREITVLFADIEGFTQLSEELETQELARINRDILELLTAAIHQYDGTLDKYIGDAVMAIWNAPLDQERHATLAVQSSQAMLDNLQDYNQRHPQQPNISIRIGVNSGPAMVGDLGTQQRHTYTAIGKTVNKAHRLHELSKEYQTHILISQATANAAELPESSLKNVKIESNASEKQMFIDW